MARPSRSRRWRTGRPEQFTAAIGIITAATILVGATIAAFVALAIGIPGATDIRSGLVQLAVLSAITSVVIYVFVVLFGLSTLNRPNESHRALELSRAAISFFLQAFSAAIFALVVISGSLFVGTGASTDAINPEIVNQPQNHHDMLNDSRQSYARAIERLEHGHTREAAGLAWVATRRATDALITAYMGETPTTIPETLTMLDDLAQHNKGIKRLVDGYSDRMTQLSNECFYRGVCGQGTQTLIRETGDYIMGAERLAAGESRPSPSGVPTGR